MSTKAMLKALCCFSLALALMALAPGSAAAQTAACDANARASFAQDVANGYSDAELEAKYGPCRDAFSEPVCTSADGTVKGTGDAFSSATESKEVLNSNTFFEKMNGCGYHPQAEMVGCDVEIRQFFGYGGFPGGSFENVRFCLDCNRDGIWDYTTLGFVHVTDNVAPGPVPPWFHLAYATTFDAPFLCTNNDGAQTNVRAILSWAQRPPHCNFRPYWGNVINFTARRDP